MLWAGGPLPLALCGPVLPACSAISAVRGWRCGNCFWQWGPVVGSNGGASSFGCPPPPLSEADIAPRPISPTVHARAVTLCRPHCSTRPANGWHLDLC